MGRGYYNGINRPEKELKPRIDKPKMDYLFDEWEKLKSRLKLKDFFIFLDYDGTLAPIAETPQQAFMPEQTRRLLESLLRNPHFKMAIVSGRELKDIKKRVGLENIIYVGNHGAQIQGPKIKFSAPVYQKSRATLERIKNDLTAKLTSVKGVILEDKGLSLSLHYRLVDKKDITRVKTILHESIILYLVKNKIKLKYGKMVFEICLPFDWDKGKAVLWLLARQKFASGEKMFVPIYIGDDVTDEDAFKALQNKGLTIFVGRPKPSYAQYYLNSPGQVNKFLGRIISLKEA